MTTPLPAQLEHLFTHQTADVNSVRLHYVIGGQGSPIVLLHGWPQTWYAWRKIMPALAERYTVIAPDLRGLGDSGLLGPPTKFTTLSPHTVIL
jgi:pimeloyl-ACP methyl ester carboxylesterase